MNRTLTKMTILKPDGITSASVSLALKLPTAPIPMTSKSFFDQIRKLNRLYITDQGALGMGPLGLRIRSLLQGITKCLPSYASSKERLRRTGHILGLNVTQCHLHDVVDGEVATPDAEWQELNI